MTQVVGSQTRAEAAVLEVCKDSATAKLLYGLGIQLDIASWQAPWLHCLSSSLPQPAATTQPASYEADPVQVDDVQPNHHQTADMNAMHAPDNTPSLDSILQSRMPATLPHPATLSMINMQQPSALFDADDAAAAASSMHLDQQPTTAPQDTTGCQQVIEHIRQVEFGVGVELDAAGTELREKQNDRLGRALQRLSQDLYSKDVHFVLELVQNADDNAYLPEVCPALEFILEDMGITIMNNEVRQQDSIAVGIILGSNQPSQHSAYQCHPAAGFHACACMSSVGQLRAFSWN